MPENIIVDIQNGGAGVTDTTKAILPSHGKDQTQTATFEYSVWANLGEKLTFIPRDPRYIILASCFNYQLGNIFWLKDYNISSLQRVIYLTLWKSSYNIKVNVWFLEIYVYCNFARYTYDTIITGLFHPPFQLKVKLFQGVCSLPNTILLLLTHSFDLLQEWWGEEDFILS